MEVSVVLSTYNGSAFIIEQMDSLRQQSVKIDEVLIFDDKSTDDTAAIVDNYIESNQLENWHLIINKENLGWRHNFMQGLWKAQGDLIFTCDQDDVWNLNKIEMAVSVMREHPEISLLTSKYEEFYPDGKTVICPSKKQAFLRKQNLSYNIFKVPYPGCTFCIRKILAEKSKAIWEPDFPHDALLWKMSIFTEGLYTINVPLIKMRKHRESSYTLESAALKNSNNKRTWIDYALRTIAVMERYIEEDNEIQSIAKKKKILNTNKNWLIMRAKFYDTRNVWVGICLIRYIKCYPKVRQYLGDWYLLFR